MNDVRSHDAVVERRLIFIGGMHRSGTTMLADMLADSPVASALRNTGVPMDEGQHLQSEYPAGRELDGMTRWALSPRAHLTERDVRNPDETRTRLWRSWSPYWNLDSDYLIEKTPLNLTRTRYLQAIFPAASFVIITRHPITQSLAIKKWSPGQSNLAKFLRRGGVQFSETVRNWIIAHEYFESDRPRLKRVRVVQFERLMTEPHAVADELEEFLNYSFNRRTLDGVDHQRTDRYAAEWETATNGGNVVARCWKTARNSTGKNRFVAGMQGACEGVVLPHARREILRKYGSRSLRLGYDLQALGPVTRGELT